MAIEQRILTFGGNKVGTVGSGFLMGAPRPFNPSRLANTLIWLNNDPNDWIFSSGTKISQWTDMSGNNLHYIQANASRQPDYDNTIFDGVRFTGANFTHLDSASIPTPLNTPFSVFLVLRFPSQSDRIIMDGLPSLNRNMLFLSGLISIQVGNNLVTAYSRTNDVVYLHETRFNGTNTNVFINGVQQGGNLNVSNLTFNGARLGARNSGAPDFPFTGFIFEKIVIDNPSEDDRTKLNDYLIEKYGL